LEKVIKAWEGLGYYSRARNLHEGARYVVEHFDGELPEEEEKLQQIKGLGPYTIGAIRSFAFRQRAAAVDGNVIRVLARYYNIQEEVSKSAVVAHIRKLTHDFLPKKEPWVVMEALIELGATVCGRLPACAVCPLSATCQGYLQGTAEQLPVKKKGPATEFLHRAVAVIEHAEAVLLRRCGKGEIMSDLHEFPYTDAGPVKKVIRQFNQEFATSLSLLEALPEVQHGFTRYNVTLTPYRFVSEHNVIHTDYFWHPIKRLDELAFSSGHRRIAQYIQEQSW
jgi:A/G-specific adenine glycosylase